ncbi:MAG: exonuclease subunit SbcD, partial [Deltaproteobacteria bacterium]
MKLLHTSDWHLGRMLHNRKRYEEHEAFLNWLFQLIENESVDVVLIAGDVFDNSTPSNYAQELYYRFLCRVASSANRRVVVIAGNHDSPSFLNAPKELLKFLNIHVVGFASNRPEDEVLLLAGADGKPGLMVLAIPYLRDRDIRTSEAGESIEDKERKIVEGIKEHYRQVCDAALKKRAALERPVPMVAMGHLFAAGGQTTEGDGTRELYIGSLAQVRNDVFPDDIDYVAL